MKTSMRVFYTIGGVQLIIEEDTPGVRKIISSFTVLDEVVGEAAIECLRRAYHNNALSEKQKETIKEFSEALYGREPIEVYSVHEYDEDTDENGRMVAIYYDIASAARHIASTFCVETADNPRKTVSSIISNMGYEIDHEAGYKIVKHKVE